METMVVVAFDGASGADFGARILRGLESQGEIRIHAMATLGRSVAGRVTVRYITEGGRHAGSVQSIAQGLSRAVEPGSGRVRRGKGRAQRQRNVASYRVGSGADVAWLRIAIGGVRRGGAVVIASLREKRITAVDLPMELSGGIVLRQTRGSIVGTILRACGVVRDDQTVDASRTPARTGAKWIVWLRTRFAPARATRKTEPADPRINEDLSRLVEMTSRYRALGLARASSDRIRRRPG